MNTSEKKLVTVLMILTIVFTIMGGTLAYFNWQSSSEQNTAVTFTVASGFSCSADGGGNISPGDIGLAPATCTNENYAIKRTVTVSPTINIDGDVYMDLWLKVNSIGSGLAASQNFKYALTTSSSNCTTGVVSQGNFNGATTNTQKTLLHNKVYSQTTNETYYLWIWLDAAETSPDTMNQTFNMELGGVCTNQAPTEQTVYTVNLYDDNATGYNSVWLGQTIPNGITTYNTPETAITALETAYSNANSGATTSLPFFLRHTISDDTLWCLVEYESGVATGYSYCIHSTQASCNANISNWEYDNYTYSCAESTPSGVSESYVGFVVTSTMATANPGMVAGTYYLKGGDNGASFLDNAKTIYDAFGGVGCYLDGNSGGNPYTTTPSSNFYCEVSGLGAYANSDGHVSADDYAGSRCEVHEVGNSNCNVHEDGGDL